MRKFMTMTTDLYLQPEVFHQSWSSQLPHGDSKNGLHTLVICLSAAKTHPLKRKIDTFCRSCSCILCIEKHTSTQMCTLKVN